MIKNPTKFAFIYLFTTLTFVLGIAMPINNIYAPGNPAFGLVNGLFWGVVSMLLTLWINRITD